MNYMYVHYSTLYQVTIIIVLYIILLLIFSIACTCIYVMNNVEDLMNEKRHIKTVLCMYLGLY